MKQKLFINQVYHTKEVLESLATVVQYGTPPSTLRSLLVNFLPASISPLPILHLNIEELFLIFLIFLQIILSGQLRNVSVLLPVHGSAQLALTILSNIPATHPHRYQYTCLEISKHLTPLHLPGEELHRLIEECGVLVLGPGLRIKVGIL